MWAIIKKEFKSYFLSPIGYIYIGVFLLMCSIFFYLDVFTYLSTDFPYMFGSASTILTFIVPLITTFLLRKCCQKMRYSASITIAWAMPGTLSPY